MSTPPAITSHISLVTPEEVSSDLAKAWFKCARSKAPYGVPTSFTVTDDKGRPQSVAMIQRETDKGVYYMVPMTRDLTEREAERIVDAFREEYPEVDFDIEATVIPTYTMDRSEPTITVDQHKYGEIAKSWAKRQHEDWVKSRMEDGWRYGTTVSISDKTHPLLRAWDELPEKFRTVDLDQPQKLLDLLNDSGYVVVSKEDLEAAMRLVKKL